MFDNFILIALNTFSFSTFEMNLQFVTQMVQTSSADARISTPGHTTNAAPMVPVMESARTPAHVSLAFPPMDNSANLKQVTILLILEVLLQCNPFISSLIWNNVLWLSFYKGRLPSFWTLVLLTPPSLQCQRLCMNMRFLLKWTPVI